MNTKHTLRRTTACLVLFVLLVAKAIGSDEPAKHPEITLTHFFADRYQTFGSGSTLSEKPVSQTDLTVSWDNGFSAGIWLSKSIGGGKEDFGNEIDFTVGYEREAGYWSLAATVSYFNCQPNMWKFDADDIVMTSIEASHSLGLVTLTAAWSGYTVTKGSSYEGGHLVELGISKEYEFSEKVGASWKANLAYDDGGFGFNSGLLVNGGAEITWKASPQLTVFFPKVDYYIPLTTKDDRKAVAVWYAGLSWSM